MHIRTLGALSLSLISIVPLGGQAPQPGWKPLFDGKSLAGWRGYQGKPVSRGWAAQDGMLVRLSGGGDIVTEDEFGDFELVLEWRVSKGGNSGIFYRAVETPQLIWHLAPEYQILDNAMHRDGSKPLTSAGACYALYEPVRDVTKPVGDWNETRIVARGAHVEHWMNGTRLLEFEIGTGDWKSRVAASKFKAYPGFGEQRSGHIGLQDHGDVVWYRNIRIRELR